MLEIDLAVNKFKMANPISEYYINELENWQDSIDLHLEQASGAEALLNEILHYNTVPQLAANVQHYINQLFVSMQKLMDLDKRIIAAKEKLAIKKAPVSDKWVNDNLIQLKEIRMDMYTIEKESLETKYAIDDFIAQVIAKQNKAADKNSDE
jgi:hypothetical protein